MSLIDSQEKEMIKEWAENKYSDDFRKNILTEPDEDCESYWVACPESADIMEYGFENIASLKQELEAVLKDDIYQGIHLNLAVGAFKMYRLHETEDDGVDTVGKEADFSIPDFVYNF